MLALALLSKSSNTISFAKQYAKQTMAKGTFDQVRMINNDLANMLAIVSGDPKITKKLKNKNQAQAMRQRLPVPVMAVRRYLHTFEDTYKFLTQLERALNITDANYRNLRRMISNYKALDSRTKKITVDRLLLYISSKLPGTDLHRSIKNFD
jgi:hypothetical protein